MTFLPLINNSLLGNELFIEKIEVDWSKQITQNTTPLFNQITSTKLDFDQFTLWGVG